MKKFLSSILLLIAVVFCVTGCGKKETTDTKETVDSNAPKTTLTFIGHAAVKIVAEDGTVLYVDPYADGDYSDKADVLLITHGHYDHQPNKDFQKKDTCKEIKWSDALVNGEYKSFTCGPFEIQAVAAGGNTNHSIKNCVGYIIKVDDFTIYHAGDTSKIDQMNDYSKYNIDYAMYPIDGVYNMGEAEATEVADMIGATNNIPIHSFDDKGTAKQDKFAAKGKLVLSPGETITLSK